MTRPSRLVGVLAVLLAVLAGACSTATPEERFAEAFTTTLDGSFAFEVLLEADQAALADLGEMAGGAAALLSGVRLRGVVDGADTSLAFDALGGTVIEVRQIGAPDDPDAAVFLRAGIVDLLAQVGVDEFEAETEVVEQLRQAGAPDEVIAGVTDAFDGEWIGVRGRVSDLVATAEAASGGEVDARAVFGADLPSFLDRYVEVSDLEGGLLHLDLRLGDLLRAAAGLGEDLDVGREVGSAGLEDDLAQLPVLVPGDVRVADGVVEEMAFDVAAAARDLGNEVEGRVVIRIRLSDHGAAGPVEVPPGVTPLSSEALDEAVALLLTALGVG